MIAGTKAVSERVQGIVLMGHAFFMHDEYLPARAHANVYVLCMCQYSSCVVWVCARVYVHRYANVLHVVCALLSTQTKKAPMQTTVGTTVGDTPWRHVTPFHSTTASLQASMDSCSTGHNRMQWILLGTSSLKSATRWKLRKPPGTRVRPHREKLSLSFTTGWP